ncbi:insulinase family protein, partial [Clostridioides difficile]
ILSKILQSNFLPNMIFFGPPGVGKTTVAEIIAERSNKSFYKILNKYYIPNNAVISIAGNFNFDDMVEKIKSKFGHWEKKNLSID